MDLENHDGRLEVRLPAVLDLVAAGDLRDTLLDALARDTSSDIILKAGAVERTSTAAIQVIMAAATGFNVAARRIEIEGASAPLVEAFRLLGLATTLEKLS